MTAVADKARRHRAIVKLVRAEPIANHDALQRALSGRGHDVTQSTLSRDLKELRILRVPQDDGYRYLPAGEEGPAASSPASRGFGSLAAAEVTAVEANEALVVVHTQIARAQGVAVYLDGLGLPDLLATIAGDDTILAVPATTKKTRALRTQLEKLFGLV